ncbi:MAG: methyltransferase domain-containing protein [Anaerolineae bacterium]
MSLSLQDLAFLTSAPGEALLERLRMEELSDANLLALSTRLRRDYTPEEARAALELARLREKAVEKFGADAQQMFFTRDALEQASDPLVRRWKRSASGLSVIDLCCGIGSDSLAFARTASDVMGIDLDPVRVEMARLNAAALNNSAHFETGDARTFQPDEPNAVIFYDPARRDDEGNRLHHVERYEPPLSLIRQWDAFRIFVKLSPGVQIDQVREYGGYVEFISVKGDLKEALLSVFPRAKGAGEQTVQAALLTDDAVYHWGHADEPPELRLSEPDAWLIEPDPALIRAGLVTDAAQAWGGAQLDDTIAYITAAAPPETPWARSWRILDWMPFSIKRLRDHLREQGVSTITVKKRGTVVTPEVLMAQLKLKPNFGSESRTIVLTRCKGEQIALICEDYDKRVQENFRSTKLMKG